MDLRIKKTTRSIINAFLTLRCKRPLERITVKDLAALAEISKATFYLHYRDIYDLSEQLQSEVIRSVLSNIPHPEYCLTDPKGFTEELFCAFYSEQSLIETLFSDTHASLLPLQIGEALMKFIKERHPDIDLATEMRLTYNFHGAYAVFQKYRNICSESDIIDLVSNASLSVNAAQSLPILPN